MKENNSQYFGFSDVSFFVPVSDSEEEKDA